MIYGNFLKSEQTDCKLKETLVGDCTPDWACLKEVVRGSEWWCETGLKCGSSWERHACELWLRGRVGVEEWSKNGCVWCGSKRRLRSRLGTCKFSAQGKVALRCTSQTGKQDGRMLEMYVVGKKWMEYFERLCNVWVEDREPVMLVVGREGYM